MDVCGYFRDKVMRMYDVANAGRSGTALCVLPQKSLTPKIFHTSVSHRKFLANNSIYKESVSPVLFLCAYELYKILHAAKGRMGEDLVNGLWVRYFI